MSFDPSHVLSTSQLERVVARDLSNSVEEECADSESASVTDLIEQFFAHDLDTEPCGMPAEEYVMMKELRNEAVARDKVLGNGAAASAAASATIGADEEFEDLEVCSRAYCAKFFREALGEKVGERPCRRARMCVFKLMAARYPDSASRAATDEGFVCREFLLPSQVETFAKSHDLPADRRMCLGCNRLFTNFYYHYYRSRDREPHFLLQDHTVLIDSPEEYASVHCIYPNPDQGKWTGIVRPFVRFAWEAFAFCPFNIKMGTSDDVQVLKGAREMQLDFRPASAAERRT